jgi:hypothetical protein
MTPDDTARPIDAFKQGPLNRCSREDIAEGAPLRFAQVLFDHGPRRVSASQRRLRPCSAHAGVAQGGTGLRSRQIRHGVAA